MIKIGEVLLTSGTPAHLAALGDALLSHEARVLTPAEILARGGERPAALFVDWLLPEMAGIELVRQLRAAPGSHRLHITLILDGDDAADRRRALAAGADDYVLGPLDPAALVARVQRLRGVGSTEPASLRLGALEVDPGAFAARYVGRAVPLSANELNLLIHFARRPNRVFTRGELIGALGKGTAVGDERTVDVWVSRLRRSLTRHGVPHVPRTVRALGYVMDAPAA